MKPGATALTVMPRAAQLWGQGPRTKPATARPWRAAIVGLAEVWPASPATDDKQNGRGPAVAPARPLPQLLGDLGDRGPVLTAMALVPQLGLHLGQRPLSRGDARRLWMTTSTPAVALDQLLGDLGRRLGGR